MPNGQSLKYLNEWTELWRLTDTLYDRQLKRWGLSLNAYFVSACCWTRPKVRNRRSSRTKSAFSASP